MFWPFLLNIGVVQWVIFAVGFLMRVSCMLLDLHHSFSLYNHLHPPSFSHISDLHCGLMLSSSQVRFLLL